MQFVTRQEAPDTGQRPPSRPATSHDVAREAGVSQSAVSLVFSGKSAGRVSAATRDIIETVAARLDYHPNRDARSLRTGTAGLIGLVVPDASHPYFGQLLVAAEHTARRSGRGLTMIDSHADAHWARRVESLLASGQLEGCVLYLGTDRQIETLRGHIGSVVLVESAAPGFASLELDIETAMGDVVNHLVEQGHSRIAYLGANYPSATFARRRNAVVRALAAHGLALDANLTASATFDVDDATQAATALLAAKSFQSATAIVCDDDLLAGGVYRACRELGLSIPRDVSVVGFGDLDLARYLGPELTTVTLRAEDVGRGAIETLVALLDGKKAPASNEPSPLPLMIRNSTR